MTRALLVSGLLSWYLLLSPAVMPPVGSIAAASDANANTNAKSNASSGPYILDFHASWCGPCRQMRPEIERLTRQGYPIRSVDIDEQQDLAGRYDVTAVPTFLVISPDGQVLARSSGYQPAAQLASLYQQARVKLKARDEQEQADAPDHAAEENDGTILKTNVESDDGRRDDATTSTDTDADADAARGGGNPDPWKTVVRIRVRGAGSIGFGSGTIIHSNAKESLIITCAHIFKLDGTRNQPHPKRFPRPVEVDLFDGVLHQRHPAQVHYSNETHVAEVIDYDFSKDVGLIRIRPGRKLAASPVVAPDWKPQPRLKMVTVGCSEGHDATAWTTEILNPRSGMGIHPGYEAIECHHAPKQGRSGGGLYTTDGYLAGVCDFAEPAGNRGLYATPRSIYQLLDRNLLTALYKRDRDQETLVADRRPEDRGSLYRAQSPDLEEKSVTLPPPGLLGIPVPDRQIASTRPRASQIAPGNNGMGSGWRTASSGNPRETAPRSMARANPEDLDRAELTRGGGNLSRIQKPRMTDMSTDVDAGTDRFEVSEESSSRGRLAHPAETNISPRRTRTPSAGDGWRAVPNGSTRAR